MAVPSTGTGRGRQCCPQVSSVWRRCGRRRGGLPPDPRLAPLLRPCHPSVGLLSGRLLHAAEPVRSPGSSGSPICGALCRSLRGAIFARAGAFRLLRRGPPAPRSGPGTSRPHAFCSIRGRVPRARPRRPASATPVAVAVCTGTADHGSPRATGATWSRARPAPACPPASAYSHDGAARSVLAKILRTRAPCRTRRRGGRSWWADGRITAVVVGSRDAQRCARAAGHLTHALPARWYHGAVRDRDRACRCRGTGATSCRRC